MGLLLLALGTAPAVALPQAGQQSTPVKPVFNIDGKVALASFVSLTDGHLRKLADSLEMVAASAAARSGKWEQIQAPLQEVEKTNVPAVLWFALPDGFYWTLEQGKVAENLASRPYFPRVLAGHRVSGDLVVSKSTGKSVAIIATPILRRDNTVAGVLGASVRLDRLSALIREEMGLDDSVIFFTFDASPLLGLVWDPGLILVDPTKLGESVGHAFREMLSRERGSVTYTFRNIRRTVLYRKSPLTGWWYAFGVLHRNQTSSRAAESREPDAIPSGRGARGGRTNHERPVGHRPRS